MLLFKFPLVFLVLRSRYPLLFLQFPNIFCVKERIRFGSIFALLTWRKLFPLPVGDAL